MLKIYTNTTTGIHYGEDGERLGRSALQVYYGDNVELEWHLVTADGEADTSFAGSSAYLAGDYNNLRKIAGLLFNTVNAGTVRSLTLNIFRPAPESIPTSGILTLYGSDGSIDRLEYSAREISADSTIFTLAPGTELKHTYMAGSEADICDALCIQAHGMQEEAGIFRFNFKVASEKLRKRMEYVDTSSLLLKTLELAVYKIEDGRRQWLTRQTAENMFMVKNSLANPLEPADVTGRPWTEVLDMVRTAIESTEGGNTGSIGEQVNGLPEVDETDEGKVMQVLEGEWRKTQIQLPPLQVDVENMPSIYPLEEITGNNAQIQPGKHYVWKPQGFNVLMADAVGQREYGWSTLDIDLRENNGTVMGSGAVYFSSPLEPFALNRCNVDFRYEGTFVDLIKSEDNEQEMVLEIETVVDGQFFGLNLTHNVTSSALFTIDWGDGTQQSYEYKTSNPGYKHTYAIAGRYRIRIPMERITSFGFTQGLNAPFLKAVRKFKPSETLTSMASAFRSCSGLQEICEGFIVPDMVNSVTNLFYGCSSLATLPASFTIPLGVTSCSNMFHSCSSLSALPANFTIPQGITDTNSMFYNCSSLSSLPETFTIPQGMTNTSSMFYCCSSLLQLPANFTIYHGVTNIASMFNGCGFTTLPEGFTIPSSVTRCESLFFNCLNLTTLPEGFTIPQGATNTGHMFRNCASLVSLPDGFTIPASVTDCSYMFSEAVNLATLPEGFTVPASANHSNMFSHCPAEAFVVYV